MVVLYTGYKAGQNAVNVNTGHIDLTGTQGVIGPPEPRGDTRFQRSTSSSSLPLLSSFADKTTKVLILYFKVQKPDNNITMDDNKLVTLMHKIKT
jgi:hypothetical protein